METVLTVLLVRFGIIAAVVVLLGLALFAVVLWMRKHGRGDQARQLAEFATRQVLDNRRRRR
ncbi:hypothetical protein FPZ12_006370 [Amycolatopsis acidicola]|uniref:Uncharacterized protein n=1 Tax=Amycolatopsis acidicola TaxID=2596893 RepID=A0A5N0VFJ6_9PSEU|nr:hypothetical protein [Amycolatopsis acidicola]KAA9164885.1 hypothetical protein FPZ12_006370 [Amycolatopsis acidicola]